MVYVRYRLYRILIIGGSGSRKVNVLLNLIKEQIMMNLLTRFICW